MSDRERGGGEKNEHKKKLPAPTIYEPESFEAGSPERERHQKAQDERSRALEELDKPFPAVDVPADIAAARDSYRKKMVAATENPSLKGGMTHYEAEGFEEGSPEREYHQKEQDKHARMMKEVDRRVAVSKEKLAKEFAEESSARVMERPKPEAAPSSPAPSLWSNIKKLFGR
jgi:hypothetical protein